MYSVPSSEGLGGLGKTFGRLGGNGGADGRLTGFGGMF